MVQFIKLFGERSAVKILLFFLRNPSEEFSQKQLLKKIIMAKATLIKQLRLLLEEDTVKEKIIGRSKLYSLNTANLIIKQLKILSNILSLKGIVEIGEKHNATIYLYGSCARGEDTENSDVDILVIGRVKKEDLLKDIKTLPEKRNIKIEVFSPAEWSSMAKKDKAFYERVEKDKIKLN